VDGNTDGKFLDGSVTHTNYEQGAWWQVDLGGQKNKGVIAILKAFKETKMMEAARNLVSLFFIFKNND
jgi:hypothetical protein